jgi:hypothetical protein
MARKEKKRINYPCQRLGQTVQVTLEYLYHETGFKSLVGFDCDGCYNCGVGKEGRPGTWTFNWSKCVHPKSPT